MIEDGYTDALYEKPKPEDSGKKGKSMYNDVWDYDTYMEDKETYMERNKDGGFVERNNYDDRL